MSALEFTCLTFTFLAKLSGHCRGTFYCNSETEILGLLIIVTAASNLISIRLIYSFNAICWPIFVILFALYFNLVRDGFIEYGILRKHT